MAATSRLSGFTRYHGLARRTVDEAISATKIKNGYNCSSRYACTMHPPLKLRDDEERKEENRYPFRPLLSMNTAFPTTHHSSSLGSLRQYHASPPSQNMTLILGLSAVALTAKAGQLSLRAFDEWKKNQPEEPPATEETTTKASQEDTSKKSEEGKERENIFQKWFGMGVGAKYYEGGFEEKMTRKEAALILGVRQSSSVKRIKEAHRRILMLNHPDTGGSNYIASKVNEAKELLLKGRDF